MLTLTELRDKFTYDSTLGKFRFKKSDRASKIGKLVGSTGIPKASKRYRIIRFGKKTYGEHRLIFYYHHGYLPEMVDHINGIRYDNRIENLREVTPSQNSLNSRAQKGSKSRYKCVYLTEYGTWKGEVKIRLGKDLVITTRSYQKEEDAARFVDSIMKEWYGTEYYFANFS